MTITDAEIARLRELCEPPQPEDLFWLFDFASAVHPRLPLLLDELERLRAKEQARLSGITHEQAPYIAGSEADE